MSLLSSGRTWDEASSPAAVRLARRFEDVWRSASAPGRRPIPGDFLADDAGCPGARLALLRAEMGLRWEVGEKVSASWYRERYPDLGEEALVALIYEEFCLREEDPETDPPEPSEYYERYPEVAPALQRVLDIHGLVGSGTATALHVPETPAVPFPAAGETIAGFQLVEELGRGAFARVFLARERQLADRPVALKVARTGSREPQTLARLQHTHIVPVHSSRTDPATGLHLLCMPYFGRITLARVLEDSKVQVARSGAELIAAVDRLGSPEASPNLRASGRAALCRRSYAQAIAWWGARMAEALEHAHDRGVLHRDVKPSNVLVTADGMPMLLDFNLARELVLDAGEADLSTPGGTLDYMAPEHLDELAGSELASVDARSDVYGLGVLLYEALVGSRPFPAPRGASSASELLRLAAADRRLRPPKPRSARPEVPAALDAIVRRCLEPDPDDRYASAAELAADLHAFADDRPLKFATEPIRARTYRWARRHRRALATALPILLALVGIAGLIAQGQADKERNWTKVKRFYDDAVASEAAGSPARAKVLYDSAVRLADKPTLDGNDRESTGPSPSDQFSGLEELRQQARFRYLIAERTEKVQADADAVHLAADSLRFRLFGFGGDLETSSNELAKILEPFHVLDADDWRKRPDFSFLDTTRQKRLAREVDELLFLWAVALDREAKHDPSLRRKALQVCDLALGFVKPAGPWEPLRGWIAARLDGADGPRVAEPVSVRGLSALSCFEWGTLLALEERKAEASVWFKRAVRLDEGNSLYHYYLAFAQDHPGGDAVEVVRHYDAAVALEPRSPWVRFTRARYYRLTRNWGQAREDLERALHDFHERPTADRDPEFECQTRLELGLVLQSLGDLVHAREEYDAVVASGPGLPYAFAARLNRAKLDADAGQVCQARAEFDALLDARPNDDTARVCRAMLRLRSGDPAGAENDLSVLIEAGSGIDSARRAEALGLRSLARLSLGRAPEAVNDARTALLLRPGPALERLRARAGIAVGRVGEVALTRPDEIAELPVNGPALRADLRRLVEQTRRALAAGTVEKDKVLEARITLAVALSALGDPTAEAEADQALALSPLSARVCLARARVRGRAGRLTDALADVDRALTLEADDPRAFELRGHLRACAGDASAALKDLDRAIALGNDGASVRRERATILMALGDPLAAARDWRQAIAHDPDDPRSFLGRARAEIALGHWDAALADLEQAAGWADDRPDLGLKIAIAYARCVPHRSQHLARIRVLFRRVWADYLNQG